MVIYPGVNIAPLMPERQRPGKVKIGTLSRLHPVKGVDRLIEVCHLLKQQQIDFELLIGGDGRQRNELTEQVDSLGLADCCRFYGEITHRQSFLDELDIFVAPSRQEAFGIHVCEAMERGLAVLGARVGGIPELIEHQRTGLLFSPDNPGELRRQLATLIGDRTLREQLGNNARQRVSSLFDRKNATLRHLELFKHICAGRRHLHLAVSSAELGGGERVALGLIKALRQRGWQISATCSGEPLASAIAATGCPVYVANMRCGGVFFALKLLAAIFILRPQIINSHLNRASLAAGLLGKLCNLPSVAHVHGLNNQSYYRYSDRLIAVSNAVKKHLIAQNTNLGPIDIISNRIDKPALAARNAHGNPIRIVITAKLHKNKGHLWALAAINEQLAQLGELHIDILGNGPEHANLVAWCQQSNLKNMVHFHGFVADPEQFYDRIDIAMLPSLGEGIPLSLLEAMRCGIPCIATNIGGIPEIVTNGRNGILVEPGDADALVKAILRIRAEYAEFSRAAIEHFCAINNYANLIDKYEALLLQALSQKQ